MKALIVDDEKMNRELVKFVLSKLNIESEQAHNGEHALNKLRMGTYDLLLTDINMPLMNGLELVSNIRTSQNNLLNKIPIICVSSESQNLVIKYINKNWINKFIPKPIDPSELTEIIEELFVLTPQ